MPGGGPRAEWRPARAGCGGAEIPAEDKINRKLKRLRRIEASYRSQIRRAQQVLKDATVDRVKAEQKFKKLRAKIEGKIEKVQPKIRELTNLKAERKS